MCISTTTPTASKIAINNDPIVLSVEKEDKMVEVYYNAHSLKALAKVNTDDPNYDSKYLAYEDIESIQYIVSKGKYNKENNTITLTQEYKLKAYERIDIGRMYIKNKAGFQSINKKLRRLAMGNQYISIDIANCQPRLLFELGVKYNDNYQSKELKEYINNREQIRKELCYYYNTDKQTIKELIIRMMYGGTPDAWMRDEMIEPKPHHNIVTDLHKELTYIKTVNTNSFPGFKDAVKYYAIHEKKHKGPKMYDAAIAVYLQNEERKIMSVLKQYLKKQYGIVPSAQIHDALVIHKDARYNDYLNENLIHELQTEIKNTLGYNAKFEYENTDYTAEDEEYIQEHLQFSSARVLDKEYIGMRTDEVHAAKWLDIFSGKIYRTKAGVFIYDENNGMWTNDDTEMYRVVSKYARDIFVDVVDGDEKKTMKSMYNNAHSLVVALSPQIKFLDMKKNRGYFLFNNGVLDCMTMEMKPFHPDYFFTRKINRDFNPDNINTDDENAVVDKMFNTAYTVPGSEPNTDAQYLFKGDFDTTKRDYFMEKLARGFILGGFDKEFLLALGETNCGKGMLTQLFEKTFDEYVDTFNTTNLLVQKNSSMEDERKWAWIAKLWDRRLVIGNEIPNNTEDTRNAKGRAVKREIPLNTDMMKTLVSGGDKIWCRLLYKDPVQVEMMAFVVILANDMPTTHCDRAFADRALMMYADRSSTKEEHFDDTEFFKADTTLKDGFICGKSIQNAVVSVMCKYYQRSVNQGMLPKPDFVKLAVQEALGSSTSSFEWVQNNYIVCDKNKIKENFELVKGARDVYKCNWNNVGPYAIPANDLFEAYKNDGGKDSSTKFGRELTKNNLVCVQKKVKGKTVNYRVGVMLPEEEEDNR